MRGSSLIVLLFAICAIPACGPSTAPPVAPPRLVAPDPRDGEVLQAFLLDVFGDPEFGMQGVPTNGAVIVLHARASSSPRLIEAERMRFDIEDQRLPSDLEGVLYRSNRPNTVAYFTNFTFATPIVVGDLTGKMGEDGRQAFVNAYPRARGYVVTALPGYSEDGTHAVVRASIGPSDHGATATAFLEKSGGKWIVKWHRLTFYA